MKSKRSIYFLLTLSPLVALACGDGTEEAQEGAPANPADEETGSQAPANPEDPMGSSGPGGAGAATGGNVNGAGGAELGSSGGSQSDPDPACLRPTSETTGPSGDLTDYDGPGTITEDGAVYENFEHSGTINIEADNVVLRNFRIDGGHYGINIKGERSGILIEDGEIYGMASAAILGVGYTGRRLYIHDSDGDGLKVQGSGGPTLIESSFIEKLGQADEAHADGNQTRGGADITFRCNNIFMPYPGTDPYPGAPYKSNATFMLQLDIENFVIEDNWLVGGNYTIYSSGGVSVRNNRFGRENGGFPDKVELRLRNGSFDEWSGNIWDDTGEPAGD